MTVRRAAAAAAAADATDATAAAAAAAGWCLLANADVQGTDSAWRRDWGAGDHNLIQTHGRIAPVPFSTIMVNRLYCPMAYGRVFGVRRAVGTGERMRNQSENIDCGINGKRLLLVGSAR